MKLPKNRESGQVLIMALILLALGSLLVVPGLNLATTNLNYHQLIEDKTLESYSADSGVQYGLCEVYNNPQDIQGALWQQSFVINNATVHVTAEYVASMGAYRITSTATSANNRSTTIETYVIIEIGLFGNAFACDGELIIKNCNLVSDTPGECDIYASGNVTLDNSIVDGDVTSGGWIKLKGPSSCLEQYPNSEVLDFPPIDPQPHEDAAKETNDIRNYDVEYKSKTYEEIGPFYIDGGHDLIIKNCDNISLKGTLYVTGDVDITNSNISGFGDIVAGGNISLNNYTFKVDDPSILPLIMTIGIDKKISCVNDGGDLNTLNTQAVLYAPDGVVYLNNVSVLGTAAADIIEVTNAYFNYPAGLKGRQDLPGAGLEIISYGYK